MAKFPHLKFIQRLEGRPRYHGGSRPNPQTQYNKENRRSHSGYLQDAVSNINSRWHDDFNNREEAELASLDENVQPIFIQVNPDLINAEFNLETFNIEIISEEKDGFIIGASLDNLRTLEEKVRGFVESERGTGKIADFWQIIDGGRDVWKPQHILSKELFEKWNSIDDETIYRLEVSIAFNKPMKKKPKPGSAHYETRLETYKRKLIERDELMWERQSHFQDFISHYGEIDSGFVELEDSFGCEVSISGKGLKDLVVNYQYVFEVVEIENVTGVIGGNEPYEDVEIELVSPDINAPEVGVIDSGIMEGNRYLSPAIREENSISYVPNDASTADQVIRGGHGTKVAGAILYPKGLTQTPSPYQLPCFVRNLRVLDSNNELTVSSPANLMQRVVEENEDCSIFNLSISSNSPYRKRHMSLWAAVLDKLVYENDVLFLISAGNIQFQAIKQYLNDSNNYPDYFDLPANKIANPAQSSFGITVGSLNHASFEDNDWKSLGDNGEISAFSRVGNGIWGHIKPDVVEYGGGIVQSKNGILRVKEHSETATELIRSTLHGGNAYGKDSVGTSFAAPKVAHIAVKLKELYPDEDINLIRALIVQGARPPGQYFLSPTLNSVRQFGYGLPILERVTSNTEQRITFYNTGEICAEEGHIFTLSIPTELREPGDEYDILIEVTLAYTAKVRRTRQKTKSYLSTWLDWTTSKIGESFEEFQNYVLKEIEGTERVYDRDSRRDFGTFNWKLNNRLDYGPVQDISRNNSSLQKDWTIMKSYELPEEICFAIRGHKGWDRNKESVPYALSVSIEILGTDIPIYELIRIENSIEIET